MMTPQNRALIGRAINLTIVIVAWFFQAIAIFASDSGLKDAARWSTVFLMLIAIYYKPEARR